MLVLAVAWTANPGKEEEMAEVFRSLENASRREPGCLMYIVHRHRENPAQFFVYEQYADEAALETHRQSTHFQQYVVGALSGIGIRVRGDLYDLLTPGSST